LLNGVKTRYIGNHFEQKENTLRSSNLATNYEDLREFL